MHMVLVALALLMSIAVGWSIGANDAANSLGTAVGARILSLRQTIVLITVFGFLGAYLQGQYVCDTIGKGIVRIDRLAGDGGLRVALVATFASCVWVIVATYRKMPISTSHSIVGAVGGAGLALALPVKWVCLLDIFLCWILTPVGAALLGYGFYRVLKVVFPRIVPEKYSARILKVLVVVSGCYVAYSWGANDVANSTGLLVGANVMAPETTVALGGLAIALGVMTWGYKVIETIGSEITHLLPLMAFSAQLASGINVHVYTVLGMPVSTSHSIVGAIFGVGLVNGMRVLNLRIMREIVVCWIATPFISGGVSYLFMKAMVWGCGP